MAYVDFDYYTAEYLCGTEAVIPESEFAFYAKKAKAEIDAMTHNSIRYLTLVPDEVKDAACAIAEHLYSCDKITKASLNSGLAGVLTSYSNDGESGTVDSSSSYTEAGKRNAIRSIARKYLAYTGLLYGGVYVAES